MKKYLLLIALLLPSVSIADGVKIGVVDAQKLFEEYVKLTGFEDRLQERFAAPKKELDEMVKDIESQDKQLKANEVMLTESKNKKARDTLIEKYRQMKEKETFLVKEKQAAYNQELAAFKEKVVGITKKLAKEEKYTLIMQKDGLVYMDESYDITGKVMTRIKAEMTPK